MQGMEKGNELPENEWVERTVEYEVKVKREFHITFILRNSD